MNEATKVADVPTVPRVLSASATVEVPFHDVDAMNVCWHGNYLKYFEMGRAALLRVFDYDYREMQASGYLWPIVEAHLKYVRPAVYGQIIEVRAQLLEYENRLKIGYEIVDCESGTRLTKGYTIQVAVDAATEELQFVSPPIVFDKLERVWGR
ncbi:acyl-CoA thioesterase [Paraburkholderia sp. ZP32-5]|uniref:acyl-CoA thioesterase n=1 Tax=Paraburkholderia sp. ZP32-5 TaxID=2883245 RepID=UPI001F2062DF|nr:thioesterase family protein [Paraburkholderia sp. ZP32-5]